MSFYLDSLTRLPQVCNRPNMDTQQGLLKIVKCAGEMKSVFGILNYRLPAEGVMPMHCSVDIGPGGKTAAFFGLWAPARQRFRPAPVAR